MEAACAVIRTGWLRRLDYFLWIEFGVDGLICGTCFAMNRCIYILDNLSFYRL